MSGNILEHISDSVHICQASVKVTGVTIMTSGNRATTGPAQRLDLASCRLPYRYKDIDSKDNVAFYTKLVLTQCNSS